MEYCLSLLYVAMDELGLIWCMDAFMERRYKDWKFWGVFAVNLGADDFKGQSTVDKDDFSVFTMGNALGIHIHRFHAHGASGQDGVFWGDECSSVVHGGRLSQLIQL